MRHACFWREFVEKKVHGMCRLHCFAAGLDDGDALVAGHGGGFGRGGDQMF